MSLHGFPARLSADGLSLRPLLESDLPEIMRQLSDDGIAPWLAAVTRPFGPAQARELLEHSREPGEHLRVIETDGALSGCICLGTGLWYWLDTGFRGKGLMSAALRLALSRWFARPAPPVVATCRTDNDASRALLRRLGFARYPGTRRMFFQAAGGSRTCHDYLVTPEQWHMLNPPRLALGALCLRPARQKDAPGLARMLPGRGTAWPGSDALPGFIETHRFRGAATGLFVIEDGMRRTIGMVLFRETGPPALRYLCAAEATRHGAGLEAALAAGLPALLAS